MNKVYKVIWSKVRNCYMVVSELAKRNGKNTGTTDKRRKLTGGLALAAMALTLNLGTVGIAEAGFVFETTPNSVAGTTASGNNALAGGPGASASGNYSIAVGAYASTGRLLTQTEAEVGAYYDWQQIIKNDSNLVNEVAVQNATNYESLRIALNNIINDATSSVAIRNAATTYLNRLNNTVSSLQTRRVNSTNSIAMGNMATVMGISAIAMGDGAAAMNPYYKTPADYAIAIGNKATAANKNAVAIGKSSGSFTQYGLSDKITSGAWGEEDIAIGTDAAAHGERKTPNRNITDTLSTIQDGGGFFTEGGKGKAIAIGYHSQAMREYTVAVGEQAMSTGENAIAMGHGARALTPGSIAIGGAGNGTSGVQQGNLNTAKDTIDQGGYSITLGRANNFTLGYDSDDNFFANTKNSIAIGNMAHTHAANAFAIGVSTDATAVRSFAIGTSSTNSTGSHQGSRAAGQGSITFGDTATVFTVSKVPNIPSGDYERATNTMVNDSIAVGTNSLSQARNAVALGGGMSYTYHSIKDIKDSSLKTLTNITKYYDGSGWVDRAVGTGAKVGDDADGAVAIGGASAKVTQKTDDKGNPIDTLYFPTKSPTESLEIQDYTAAAKATVARSVSLGTGSVANRGPATNSGYDVTTGTSYAGSDADSHIWKSTVAAVSVGGGTINGKTITRQITNVAAGLEDTDAVNVAQLKRVSAVIETDNRNVGLSTNADGKREITSPYIHVAGVKDAVENNDKLAELQAQLVTLENEKAALVFAGGSATDIAVKEAEIMSKKDEIDALKNHINNEFASAGDVSIAIGKGARATAKSSIAMGEGATASSKAVGAIVIGSNAHANAEASNAVAIGSATIVAKDALAAGNTAKASADSALAAGAFSKATGANSVAVGSRAEVDKVENGTALGADATVSVANGIALGSSAKANREATNASGLNVSGYDAMTGKPYEGNGATGSTWRSTLAAVSLGEAEDGKAETVAKQTRQITGLAAGTADTDAVNVAQLKRVSEMVDAVEWNVGIGDAGGISNGMALSKVGGEKNNVKFYAGEGINISSVPLADSGKDGYGINIASRFASATVVDGHITQITYHDGNKYTTYDLGDASAVKDVTSDKRAVVTKPDPNGKDRQIVSPFIQFYDLKHSDYTEADYAIAANPYAIAIGRHADALGVNSLSVGHNADATDKNATAIGYNTHAHGENSLSVGTAATTSANRSIAIGTSASFDTSAEKDYDPTIEHQGARAAGQGSIVLGDQARAMSDQFEKDEIKKFEAGEKIGRDTDSYVSDAIAIGTKAQARAQNAIAMGGDLSYTDAEGKTTYGKLSGRTIGATVGDTADSGIAIGGAYGTIDKESGKVTLEMDAAATYGMRGIAIGSGALVADPEDFKALENLLDTEKYANAKNAYNKAKADYVHARNEWELIEKIPVNDPTVPVENRISQYDKDVKKKAYEQAEDKLKLTTEAYALQVSEKLRLEEQDAEKEKDAIAIGTQAVASITGSVAIGSNSLTTLSDKSGVRSGLSGYDVRTDGTFKGDEGVDADSPVWRSTAGSLSVGGGTITVNGEPTVVTRRITNVAAGVDDTDVVNVAQLKRAASFSTDSRNTSIGYNEEGSVIINSPYINVAGVKEASAANSTLMQYKTLADYQSVLQSDLDALNTQKTTTKDDIANVKSQIRSLENKISAETNSSAIADLTRELKDKQDQLEILSRQEEALTSSITEKTNQLRSAGEDYNTAKEVSDTWAQATGEDAMALGKSSKATAKDTIAIGTDVRVTGKNSFAVGTGHKVYGDNSGTYGDPNVLASNHSYVIGNDNRIGSTKYAEGDTITNENIFIMGNDNHVDEKQEHVYVLGSKVTKTTDRSVFLGNESGYAEAGNSTAGMDGYGTSGKKVTINGNEYEFAGATPEGVVSVGYQGEIDGESVTITRRIQNVSAGLISAESTDAINGSQLYAAMQALSVEVKADADKTTKVTPTTNTTGNGAGGGTGSGTEIPLTPSTTYEVAASTTKVFKGSDNLTVTPEDEAVVKDNPKSYEYTIDLAKDIKNIDSIQVNNNIKVGDNTTIEGDQISTSTFKAGNTTMNNDGITIEDGPSMTKDGVDAGGKPITKVAKGEADTDAVNVAQMREYAANNNQAMNDLGNQISNVDNRARKGIAGAAALAALHPMDFDPDDKLTFAAGMGHYRGETAAALGMFYRPDEKVMFSLGGTVGNGENMVNAGVSFSLDRTSRVTGSRTALTKEVVQLREHVARQDAQIAELTALVRQLAGNAGVNMPAASSLPTAMPAMFPDNLDNKWAYDSIEELQQKGYITGYAGRTLTREEFAAALDMAMKRGATLEERLVKEFGPELSHVRVAHVEGKGNEEGEWYERPRFSYDKLEKKHEIEKRNARVVTAKQK